MPKSRFLHTSTEKPREEPPAAHRPRPSSPRPRPRIFAQPVTYYNRLRPSHCSSSHSNLLRAQDKNSFPVCAFSDKNTAWAETRTEFKGAPAGRRRSAECAPLGAAHENLKQANAMSKLRILIADDHDMIRRGLRATLTERSGWEVCAEAADGVVAVTRPGRPSLTLPSWISACRS